MNSPVTGIIDLISARDGTEVLLVDKGLENILKGIVVAYDGAG
jgi:hypothetical protein